MEAIKNFKIFLVDDDPFCMSIYQQHLTNLGCQDITGFGNGADCLAHLTEQPDVIFLDHAMENLKGLDVIKKIKRINRGIYVVFLSGQANIITAVKALNFGAFEYIVKGPYELENITKVLHKIARIRK